MTSQTQSRAITTRIVRGHGPYPPADVIVVIDVIRAYTSAHVAFLRGARRLLLASTPADAQRLRLAEPDLLLIGEVGGHPIPGFDFSNSPAELALADLAARSAVLVTTNGVPSVLNAIKSARLVLATGYSNSQATAASVVALADQQPDLRLVVAATHPTSDEDLACAEYLVGRILGNPNPASGETLARIRGSDAAAKFLDPTQPAFLPEDLDWCCRDLGGQFVMTVDASRASQLTAVPLDP